MPRGRHIYWIELFTDGAGYLNYRIMIGNNITVNQQHENHVNWIKMEADSSKNAIALALERGWEYAQENRKLTTDIEREGLSAMLLGREDAEVDAQVTEADETNEETPAS